MASKGFNITGGVKNAKKLHATITGFKSQVLEKQIGAVQEATFLVHSNAVKLIQDNVDGSPQVRYKPKRVVNVSNPGEPPNTDKGRLVQSIKFDFKEKGLIGRIGTNLKYGKDLEFGTKKMRARPWLSTAIQIVSKDIADIFKRALKGAVKESKK